MKKLKVLFFAEGATLAHVARPLMLAKGLDLKHFDVVLCRPESFSDITVDLPFPVINLRCQDRNTFAHKLELGLPLYDFAILRHYVDDDLALIDHEKPDIVIGDFRLSLSVSARLRTTPYITICDAYWSPERKLNPPLPAMGFTRFVPIRFAEFIFRLISPLAFRLHALPLERLRAEFGLPSLGFDLRRCYTDADLRLFANFSALFQEIRTDTRANFIGPIAWSPDHYGGLEFLDGNEPLIYVTMGSSGDPGVLEQIVPVLEKLGSRIVITTAGKALSFAPNPLTTQVFNYLPGSTVCQSASLVICNGGSPTTNQALSCGVPVLGIAHNMDQFLNMDTIVKFGAGLLIRADRVKTGKLEQAIRLLLNDPKFTERAKLLMAEASVENPPDILTEHILLLCGTKKCNTP